MVLGAPLTVVYRGILNLTFPDGHALTDENLHELSAHYAEFMCILEPDMRTDEELAVDVAQAAARVKQLFEGADLSDPTLMALYDQVLDYRSA